MWEVIKVGRQWQIHKDGELYCLPPKNTKHAAEFHMTKLVFAITENEAFEAERAAARKAKADAIRTERAKDRNAQASLF